MAYKLSGGNGGGATPVLIPNTEVKPSSADGTALVTVWESRSLPEAFLLYRFGFETDCFVENVNLPIAYYLSTAAQWGKFLSYAREEKLLNSLSRLIQLKWPGIRAIKHFDSRHIVAYPCCGLKSNGAPCEVGHMMHEKVWDEG